MKPVPQKVEGAGFFVQILFFTFAVMNQEAYITYNVRKTKGLPRQLQKILEYHLFRAMERKESAFPGKSKWKVYLDFSQN